MMRLLVMLCAVGALHVSGPGAPGSGAEAGTTYTTAYVDATGAPRAISTPVNENDPLDSVRRHAERVRQMLEKHPR
ncbi:MAG: hypothetical protein AAF628_32165 [Planctomycetota bacterium]